MTAFTPHKSTPSEVAAQLWFFSCDAPDTNETAHEIQRLAKMIDAVLAGITIRWSVVNHSLAAPRIYTRTLVPDFIRKVEWDNKDAEYSPWTIGHTNKDCLTNRWLDKHYKKWHDEDETGDFSEFINYLEQHGYKVFNVEAGGVWSPK